MSELRANTISDAAGTGPITLTGQYASKAWVNFNGTGTVTIREDGNVSSITDNGTGDYTVNFAAALEDANYAIAGAGRRTSFEDIFLSYKRTSTPTASSVRIVMYGGAGATNDCDIVNVTVVR